MEIMYVQMLGAWTTGSNGLPAEFLMYSEGSSWAEAD